MLAPADADIVRRDPALPGLATLLDPNALLRILQTTIDPQLRDARPRYVRYKPSTNCLVGFEVDQRGIAKQGYAIAYAKDEPPKSAHAADAVVDDQNIAIFMFPNDAEIKTLRRLDDAPSRGKLLQKLLPKRRDLWDSSFRLLAYKPQRRVVAQLIDAADQPRAVIKLYADEESFSCAARAAKVFASEAKRIARMRQVRAVVLEWAPGQLLSEMLSDNAALRQTAVTLRELHREHRGGLLPVMTSQAVGNSLAAAADELSVLLPDVTDLVGTLARSLRERLSQVDAPLVTTHGDFYPRQVLIGENGHAALIDFDEAALAHAASDVGNFLAHLHRAGLDPKIGERFVDDYRAAGGNMDANTVATYTAAALFRLASQPFRDREPDWPAATKTLLDLVKRFAPRSSIGAGTTSIDPAMPFLEDALDPQVMREESRSHVVAARLVRHKPGRRCLIEYDVQTIRKAPLETIIGKIRAKGLDQRTYRVVVALRSAGFSDSSPDRISVPEPRGTVPKFHMWLQQKLDGRSATDLLREAFGVEHARRFAAAAIKLHRAQAPTSRRHTVSDELRILHERLPLACETHPQWKDRIAKLLRDCEIVGQTLADPPELCGIHRDFYADQIVTCNDRLYLLDLDMYCIGDPALDAGNFIAHITEQSLRELNDPNALADRERAFEASFIAAYGDDIASRIRAYVALTLARHVYISTRIPSRRGITEALLSLAEQRLADLR